MAGPLNEAQAANDALLETMKRGIPADASGPPSIFEPTPNPRQSLVDLARQTKVTQDEDEQRRADLLKWMSTNNTLTEAESRTVGKLSAATGVDPSAIVAQGIENFRKAHAYKVDWYDVANKHPVLAELIGDPAHGPSAITETQTLLGWKKWLGDWELVYKKNPIGIEVPVGLQESRPGTEGMIVQAVHKGFAELAMNLQQAADVTHLDVAGLLDPAKMKDVLLGEGDFSTRLQQAYSRSQNENRASIADWKQQIGGLEDIAGDLQGYGPAAKMFTNTIINHVIPTLPMVGFLGAAGEGVGLAARVMGLGQAGASRMLFGAMFAANTLLSTGAIKTRLDEYKDPETGKTFDEDQKRLISLLGGVATGYVWSPGITNIVRREMPSIMPKVVEQTAQEVLSKATTLQILRDASREWGSHIVEGGLTMASGAMMEESAFQLGRSWSLGRSADPVEVAKSGAAAFRESLYLIPLLSLNSTSRVAMERIGRMRRANDAAVLINRMLDPAEQPKLARENPDLYERYIRRVVDWNAGSPKNAYVPREAFDAVVEKLGGDPRELHSTLVGDGGKSYDLARNAQEQDLTIPIEKVHRLAESAQLSEFARNEMRLFDRDLSLSEVAKQEAAIQKGMLDVLEGLAPEKRAEAEKYVDSIVRPPLEETYGQTKGEIDAAMSVTGASEGGPKPEHKDAAIRLGVQWVFRSLLETYATLPPEARGADFLEFAKNYLKSDLKGGLMAGPKGIDAGIEMANSMSEFHSEGIYRRKVGADVRQARGMVMPSRADPAHPGEVRFLPGANPQMALFRIADFRTFMHEWFHLDSWLRQRFVEQLNERGITGTVMHERYKEMLDAMETSSELRRFVTDAGPPTPGGDFSVRKYVATEEKGAYSFEEWLVQASKGTLSADKASELSKEIGALIADFRPDERGAEPGYANRRLGLIGVLDKLSRAPSGGLDPAMVAVFEKLIGSDAASSFAMSSRGAVPLQVIVDGLPEHVRAKYLEAFTRARDAARFAAVEKIIAAHRQSSEAFVQEARQSIANEQRAVLQQDKTYQVLEGLGGRAGEGTPFSAMFGSAVGKVKLDPATVSSFVGRDAYEFLKEQHPDIFGTDGPYVIRGDAMKDFAQSFGYDSALQMLGEMYRRPPLEAAVSKFADEGVRQIVGDGGATTIDLGRVALQSQESQKALIEKSLIELRFIASKLNPDLQHRSAIMDHGTLASLAQRSIMERKWGAFKPESFLRGERQWGDRAWQALEAGKFDDAYGAKEAQIFNQIYYSEALRVKSQLSKVRDTIKSWSASNDIRGTMGKASIPLRDLFDHVASAMGVGINPVEAAQAPRVIQDFLSDLSSKGVMDKLAFDPGALQEALDRLTTQSPQVYDMHALSGIAKNLRNIADYVAEQSNAERQAQLQSDREQIRTELRLVGGEAGSGGVSVPSEAVPGEGGGVYGPRGKRGVKFKSGPPSKRDWLHVGDALLTAPELLIEDLGKRAHDVMFKPFLKQQQYENNLRRDVFSAFSDLGTNKKEWAKLANKVAEGLDTDLPLDALNSPRTGERDHSYLWMLALNYGNAEGRQRLKEGYGWSEQQILGALEKHLSKKEWGFIESVWKFMDDQMWPLVKGNEELRTGLTPDRVQAMPFQLSDGTVVRGGYFPLRYDPLSHRSIERQIEQATRGEEYQPPIATAHNFTYSRSEKFVDTLHLDWSVLPSHINAVLHDVAFRGYLSDMRQLFRDPALSADIITYHGKEKMDAITAWLRAVALNGSEAMPPHLATAMRYLAGPRRLFQKAVLGASIPVVAADFFNPIIAAVSGQTTFRDLAPGWLKGFDPSAYDFVRNRSEQMRDRYDKPLEKWRDQFDVGEGKASRWGEVTDRIAYFFMDQADKMVSTQIWHAKYREILRTSSGDESAAIEAADTAVRRSLPAQSLLERPAILRDKNVLGAMVMFYSWFNKTYNLARESWRGSWGQWLAADTGMEKLGAGAHVAAAAGRLMAIFAISAVWGDYVAGHGRQPSQTEGEWLANRMMLAPLTALPWAAQIFDTQRGGGTPGIPILGYLIAVRNDLGAMASQNKYPDDKALALLHLTMMTAGLPANQARRVAQYGLALEHGWVPHTVLSGLSGLGYGYNPGKQADNPFTDLESAVK